jgi:type II secretory pathway predicted ATPase ExeA
MAYAFRRAEGFVMVTGQPGTGKTTLIGDMVNYLSGEDVVVANLVSTQLAEDDLLRMVGFAFNVKSQETDKSTILQQLETRFLALHKEGGRALLIVDEAQDLSARAMEELRLLTNLQLGGNPLLQIFLLGQPELQNLVHDKQLEPVHQRIIAASHLEPLPQTEIRAYVEHRMRVVGWDNDPAISAAVYPIIHRFSDGVPRRINLFCNRLLLHGYVEQRHRIGVADAHAVAKELQTEQLATRNILNEAIFRAEDDFDTLPAATPCDEETGKTEATDATTRSADTSGDAAEKAQFEARDIPQPGYNDDAGNSKKYMGVERRRGNRRDGEDRRSDVRFEPDKEDRRKSDGRRKDDTNPKFW